ncbi:glutamate racemase [Flavobacteriaceae bacterium KMM 6897]|nr:glutamate racemase [Flavobacteriaceae bacterium KMM 6897]MEB8346928.1 glutamate racemase [Flavobacteriaceae bacterium KMM 6898]
MDNRPIGIFDSGVGGTSVWREIEKLLPNEDTIYLADSKNAPYGERSKEEILQLSIKNIELLLAKDCKLIVVACNTATTNAISYVREHYKVPFIGTEPAIKPAALRSKSKTVGVLATKGTLSSELFFTTSQNHAGDINRIVQVGTGLVPLIEAGEVNSSETRELLQTYLEPMLAAGMDYLVLGCTHYPYLIPVIKEMIPPHVEILDSGAAIARQTLAILKENGLLSTQGKKGTHLFYTNADPEILASFLTDKDAHHKTAYLDF